MSDLRPERVGWRPPVVGGGWWVVVLLFSTPPSPVSYQVFDGWLDSSRPTRLIRASNGLDNDLLTFNEPN